MKGYSFDEKYKMKGKGEKKKRFGDLVFLFYIIFKYLQTSC